MADTAIAVTNKPTWVDLASSDAAAARDFYSRVFGWDIQVSDDPQYGGYGRATVGGQDAAGLGPKQGPNQPSVWTLYIGTDDVEALAGQVTAAGGSIVMAPFDVGDQGRMAVFRDPSGAYISAWQTTRMGGFQTQGGHGSFGWADLNARGYEAVLPFYERVFGWTAKPVGTPERPYTELQLRGQSIVGATEMDPMVPEGVPNYWLVYFDVDDVDTTHRAVIDAGGRELVPPIEFPGGRMSIVSDPEGAAFGLMRMAG